MQARRKKAPWLWRATAFRGQRVAPWVLEVIGGIPRGRCVEVSALWIDERPLSPGMFPRLMIASSR